MSDNSVKDIKDYFSTAEKPVSTGEMMEFWKSLSDGEKDYYKNVNLSQ